MSGGSIDRPNRLELSERALKALKQARIKIETLERARNEPIAVIGMGCRYPGGVRDPATYWELLNSGRDAVTEVPDQRWDIDRYYDPDPAAPGKICTRGGGFVPDVDRFDSWFFGISPREATGMDPQQRLFIEVCWEALENANLPAEEVYGSLTGVFAGVCSFDYAGLKFANQDPEAIDAYFATGNAVCAVAGRSSYVLGLKGPSLSIDTACSSSIVSVHYACQSLRNGECNMALAGGVNLLLTPELSICFSKAGMLAPDGRCKTFDASADGYVRSEGCGVLVLKRLSDALADGDEVMALIRGSAVNQDGPSGGLTVPSGPAQEAVIGQAVAAAGIEPGEVAFVEAHGTGTSLGDPIEVNALAASLCKDRSATDPLLIGSVKTNIGHTEGAAGVAGIIKVVLSLLHRRLPRHLHFRQPSPHVRWDELPLAITTETRDWPGGRKRIAGVSSFGATGTNAHIVLEEAPPATPPVPAHRAAMGQTLLTVSAKTEAALVELTRLYEQHLESHPEQDVGDICAVSRAGRSHFGHRIAVLGNSRAELGKKLSAYRQGERLPGVYSGASAELPELAYLFTGQGSQYPGMGRGLYDSEPVFRDTMDRCDAILRGHLDRSIVELMYGDASSEELLSQTAYTQPALLAFEYSLSELWRSWGLRPTALLGHSVGEYAAACVAGVFGLEDALKLIAARGRLMQALPAGAMAAVFASETEVARALEPYRQSASIAAVNGPKLVVVSGTFDSVDAVISGFEKAGVGTQALNVSHAFHSPMMDQMLDEFAAVAREITYCAPQVRIVSHIQGASSQPTPASAEYWVEHVSRPVLYAAGIKDLARAGIALFLEVGPRPTLIGMGRSCLPAGDSSIWLPSIRPGRAEPDQMMETLGDLYTRGASIRWKCVGPAPRGQKPVLPTYPFQRQRYWIEPATGIAKLSRSQNAKLPGRRLELPLSNETRFESTFSRAFPRYIEDHRLFGTLVVAGASHLSTLLLAVREAGGASGFALSGFALSDLLLQQPMVVPEEGELSVQVILDRQPAGAGTLKLVSRPEVESGDPDWKLHVTGDLAVAGGGADAQGFARVASVREAGVAIDGDALYSRVAELGHHLGASFRWIREYWSNGDEIVARLAAPDLPPASGIHLDEYVVYPGLIDSCIQPFCILGPGILLGDSQDRDGGDAKIYIPFSIGRLNCQDTVPLDGDLWCHTRLLRNDADDSLTADVVLYDQFGNQVLALRKFTARRLGREVLEETRAGPDDVYSVDWQRRDREQTAAVDTDKAGAWIILADGRGIGQALAEQLALRGSHCVLVKCSGGGSADSRDPIQVDPADPAALKRLLEKHAGDAGCAGVVHLWSLDSSIENVAESAHLAAASLLTAVQGLVGFNDAHGRPARLWVGTTSAVEPQGDSLNPHRLNPHRLNPHQAPVWGLCRVIEIEHPELQCANVDLSAHAGADDVSALCDELLGPDGEGQIALRSGARYVARLQRQPLVLPSAPVSASLRTQPQVNPEAPPQRVRISEYGILENLSLVPMIRRAPARGEVEIRVRATGLNFRDVLRALGMLRQFEARLGFGTSEEMTFGFECSGTVVGVGEGVEDLRVGDHVVAALTFDGSLSSYITVEADFVFARPPSLSFNEAATLPLAYLTAFYGLCQLSEIGEGDSVLIHAAAGGVGTAAVQIALAAGAKVYGTASPGKWGYLASLGVEHPMNSRTTDFAEEIMERTGGRGVDLILNSLNGEFIPKSLEVLRDGGRFVEIGKIGIWEPEQIAEVRPDVIYQPFDLWNVSQEDPDLIRSMFGAIAGMIEEGRIGPLNVELFPVTDVVRAFRHMAQARHIGKVVLAQPESGDSAAAQSPASGPIRGTAASYLVTGGLGGLGLKVAQWLCRSGARHLVLVGRSEPGPEAQSEISAWRASGVEVTVVAGDVSKTKDVDALFDRIGTELPPLKGIVHAAGCLADGALRQLSRDSLNTVMAPKVEGAWNLHRRSLGLDLDFLVLFSSAASLLGSAGQGNYAAANAFMDALAHFRRASNLPALSICWGPWGEVGMAAGLDQRQRDRLSDLGIEPIAPGRGLQVLEALLTDQSPQVGVMPVRWPRYLDRIYKGRTPRFFEAFAPKSSRPVQAAPAESTGVAARLAQAPEMARQAILEGHLRDSIAAVMGMPSGNQIEARQRLFEIGIDSLMAVELGHVMQTSLGISLPSTVVFDYPTLESLASHLADRLGLNSSADNAPPGEMADAASAVPEDSSEEEIAALLEQEMTAKESTQGNESTP